MGFLCFKVVVLVASELLFRGSPEGMLQHPTSSQSIVFHPQASTGSSGLSGSASSDQYSNTIPKYEYKYEVSDHQTGDRKSHWESRDGDKVRGAYSLYEPDGALRTVEYTADSLHGFNAVVRREEPKHHGSFSPSSNRVQEGYDSSSQPRYSSERNPYSHGSPDTRTSSGYTPGVGYSVNHLASPRVDTVKPYL